MQLTKEKKKYIDSKSYEALLSHWRFAPLQDSWLSGETGKYWGERMAELRALDSTKQEHTKASKAIGWG